MANIKYRLGNGREISFWQFGNNCQAATRPSVSGIPRALSAAEIKAFWENLDRTTMGDGVCRALKLILVTAQRPGEVIGMHRREIEGNWWSIPAERSKNRQAHRVFLTPLAPELIGDKDGYIFESPTFPGIDAAGNPLPSKP